MSVPWYLMAKGKGRGGYKTASGPIVSVSDALAAPIRFLVANIEPVQDLHGYDNPWPAGGGVNKYAVLIGNDDFVNNGGASHSNDNGTLVITTDASGSASGVYIPQNGYVRKAIDECSEPLTVSMDIVGSTAGNVRIVFCGAQQLFSVTTAKQRISVTATTKTALNFNIYGVNNGAVLRVSNLQIESGSTATPYAPYSNICPISGWSEATVTRTGKNLLNPSVYSWRAKEQNGLSYTVQNDGTIHVTGTATATGGPSCTTDFSLPNGTYSYIDESSTNGVYCVYRKRPKGGGSTLSLSNPFIFDGTYKIYVNVYCKTIGTYDLILHPQIEVGSTATEYQQYSGQTITIPFGQTVYGGTLDVTSGVLTVDRAIVDLGTLSWAYNTTYAFFTSSSLTDRKVGVLNLISDLFKTQAGSWSGTPLTNAIWGNSSNATIYVQYPITEVSEFLSLISGHQLVYELATPITIPLTATQISTLQGQDTLWADSGDVTVEYLASGGTDPNLMKLAVAFMGRR